MLCKLNIYLKFIIILLTTAVAMATEIKVLGQKITYDNKTNASYVNGEASVERFISVPGKGGYSQNLTANDLVLYFLPSENHKSQSLQNIDRIEATGEVKFKFKDLAITADVCTYYAIADNDTSVTPGQIAAGRIVCTGNVKLTQGNNTLIGGRVEVDLQGMVYTVTPSSPRDRVEVILPTAAKPLKGNSTAVGRKKVK